MRIAKGFKGRYFSLAAITATSSQVTLHALSTAFSRFFVFKTLKEAEEEEVQDPPELLETELQTKPSKDSGQKSPSLPQINTHLLPPHFKLKIRPLIYTKYPNQGIE